MADFLIFGLQLGLPILLIAAGWYVGSQTEKKHYASIKERERRFLHKPALTSKQWDSSMMVRESTMAVGSVVVSIDHFKRFVSVFTMLFGGEIHSYASLIDRARREALLRMKESQPDADSYVNTRLVTSSISNASGRDAIGTVEVLAYATALKFAGPSVASE